MLRAKLFDELQRVQASEIVLPPVLLNDDRFVARLKAIRSCCEPLRSIDDIFAKSHRASHLDSNTFT